MESEGVCRFATAREKKARWQMLLRGGDGFGNAVDGMEFDFAPGPVAVDEDGEGEGFAAGRGQVLSLIHI